MPGRDSPLIARIPLHGRVRRIALQPSRPTVPPTREVHLLPLETRTNEAPPPLLQGVAPLINGVPKAVVAVATLRLHGAARRAAARRPPTPHLVAVPHPAALSGAAVAVAAAAAGVRVVAAAAVVVPAGAVGK